MKLFHYIIVFIASIMLCNCTILKPVSIIDNDSIYKYRYIYISPTQSLVSSSGATINGQYYYSSKSVNPRDVISGILIKEGFIIIPEIEQELTKKTLIVNYGESNKRLIAGGLGGYAIEVTIQFISAKDKDLVYSCTAEGLGSTEADDIRQAITRALSGINQ